MIYYISDTHFCHGNIIDLCNRPFTDVEEMNRTISINWNYRVTDEDTVYVLGDVAYKGTSPGVEQILYKLNGHKHLIVGNHDSDWMADILPEHYFESVDGMLEIVDGGRRCTLCHYPMLDWDHRDKAYMIYGHIHNNRPKEYWQYIAANERMLNAGVEVNSYMPVTLDELISYNDSFRRTTE